MHVKILTMLFLIQSSIVIGAENNSGKPTIGFVSNLGPELTLRNIAFSGLEWRLDEYINKIGSEKLTNLPDFEYKEITIPKKELRHIVPEFKLLQGTVLPQEDLDVLSNIGQEHELDWLLIVIPVLYGDFIGGSGQKVKGYGIYYVYGPHAVYVSAHVSLLKISDKKIVNYGKLLKYKKLDFKTKEVPEEEKKKIIAEFDKKEPEEGEDLDWELEHALRPRPHHTPSTFQTVTPEERKYIKTKLLEIIDQSISIAIDDSLSYIENQKN